MCESPAPERNNLPQDESVLSRALTIARYVIFALLLVGAFLLAFAWYRGTHSKGYTVVTCSALWFSVIVPFITLIVLCVFVRGWRLVVGSIICVLLIASFFGFMALQDQIMEFLNIPVTNPWFEFTCSALLKIATASFVIMCCVSVFLIKRNSMHKIKG
ncbi:hypothetical protein [Gardnerella vaginalis]|uniref:hypothetical protein n=1 Tax=Gardnerella vaginalis TaxID=2702 RepID=UPI0039F11CBA